MAKGLSGLIKSVKKKITLKGAVGLAGGLAGSIPIIGGAISTAANALAAGKKQAAQAQQQGQDAAVQQFQASGSSGTFQTNPAGPQAAGFNMNNPLLWVGVGLAALFLLKRR